MIVVGVDVGGTFTDVILTDTRSGRQVVNKVPSTPESQDVAVVKGISEILSQNDINAQDVNLIVHGTTVATNAMLQRRGARVCLVTTQGLEDVLEIGRQNRHDIYDLLASRPEPLVPKENRFGVTERLDWSGSIVKDLESSEVSQVVQSITEREFDAVAISLLFSYRNPTHEEIIKEALKEYPGLYTVTSSEVLPEFREYERTSTTVLEAYLGPLVLGYLDRLDQSITELCPVSRLTVMQSNGGTVLCSEASGRAVGLAISGLAGGAIGGWDVAAACGVEKAITLDMGGTSCDISAIDRSVKVRSDNDVGGLPLRVPSVDVKTIGAGGGSIGWVDTAGVLHVGPQSAGANPGPAAYAKGGQDATITDANLILGRLNPEFFLGGRLPLDIELARSAITQLAQKLSMSVEETARGIIRVSTSNMVQATREVTVERGQDPREYVLVPFGGAGPTQAIDIAESLDIERILIPPHPGITSAYGLIVADLRIDLMRTVLVSDQETDKSRIIDSLRKLEENARELLANQGASPKDINISWSVDMRYVGQSHELTIEVPNREKALLSETRARFEEDHRRSFGYILKDREIEWVTTRVVARAQQPRSGLATQQSEPSGEPNRQTTLLLPDGQQVSADVYRRKDLPSKSLSGPVIIEQVDTTTYVSPDWMVEPHKTGSLWLRRFAHD
jgi:N-methylhydantoinase A